MLLLAAGIVASVLTYPIRGESLTLPMHFDAGNVGGPASGAAAELWRPPGAGPFPAVILLPGCGGESGHEQRWAARLASWGYVGVILDSYRPRLVKARCGRNIVSAELRGGDLADLVAFLRTLPDIAADRIAVIGFSQGSGTALTAAIDGGGGGTGIVPPLQALVAYYPGCRLPPKSRLSVDTLILVGADDTLVSIERCTQLVAALRDTRHPAALRVYPHAAHNFDGTNSEAAAQSIVAARAFLAEHLKPQNVRAR